MYLSQIESHHIHLKSVRILISLPVGEKSCHQDQIEAGEVLRISESQKLCQDYAGDSKCEGQLVHQFHLVS